jgi:small subunit ribosomal protein S6
MVLLDNREVKQGWEPLKASVSEIFAKSGAEIVSARRWDERRLAYPIKGQTRGTYLLVYFNGDSRVNTQLRRDLEFSELVLRHLITSCEQVPEQAFEPEAEFDVSAIPDEAEPRRSAMAEEEVAEESAADAEPSGAEPTLEGEAAELSAGAGDESAAAEANGGVESDED